MLSGRRQKVLPNYPRIDLLEFNHGTQVTSPQGTASQRNFARSLADIFNSAAGFHSHVSYYRRSEEITPATGDFSQFMAMAGRGKLFNNVRVEDSEDVQQPGLKTMLWRHLVCVCRTSGDFRLGCLHC